MFSSNWRQREQNARDKLAERQEREADPAYQAGRAAQQQLIWDAEEQYRAEKERERLEKEGPARPVAALFRERFADDLPEVYTVLRKSDGLAKLLRLLRPMVEEDLRARRDKAEAARIEAETAQMLADGERRIREQAERETKRKNKAAETAGAAPPECEASAA